MVSSEELPLWLLSVNSIIIITVQYLCGLGFLSSPTRNLGSNGLGSAAAAAMGHHEVLLWQLEDFFYICTVQYNDP